MKRTLLVTLAMATLLQATMAADENQAKALLKNINDDLAAQTNTFLELLWKFETNVTDENLENLEENANPIFEFDDENLPWTEYKDPDTIRQAKLFGIFKKTNSYPPEYFQNMTDAIDDMVQEYYGETVCTSDNALCNLTIDYDLAYILETSNVSSDLLYYWNTFTNKFGPAIRPLFLKYVALANGVSKLDGFSSRAEDWLSEFEEPTDQIERELQEVVNSISPLYKELLAYVRTKLNALYGNSVVPKTGPIPVHVLGSYLGDDWQILYESLIPYPDTDFGIDVDDVLESKNYTPLKIFQHVEKVFKGMNMKPMTDTFWKKSVIQEPEDREVVCDSSAWDFVKGDDFRIEICTDQTTDSLLSVYSLMTLVENYMYFADQPMIYRNKPLAGFGSGIVSALRHSVESNKHLHRSGLLDQDVAINTKADLNYLMFLALHYVTFTTYTYTMESWRRDVFRGKISKDKLNGAYWELRRKYGGVVPPSARTEQVLDAAVDPAIIGDDNLMRYFTRMVLQFQIYRDLCSAAGEFDSANPDKKPLYQCDFTGSTLAGDKLGAMMKLGASKPWYDVLAAGTNARKFDGSAMVDYFKPLYTFLQAENKKAGATAGW